MHRRLGVLVGSISNFLYSADCECDISSLMVKPSINSVPSGRRLVKSMFQNSTKFTNIYTLYRDLGSETQVFVNLAASSVSRTALLLSVMALLAISLSSSLSSWN
jgi:hypothetical protein